MHEATSPQGEYIYCIIPSSQPRQFGNRGIGERGDIVRTIHAGDLAAVVSASPIVEYDNSRRNMMAHTRVLEEVLAEFPILPVRFGIVAPSASAIQQQLLTRRRTELLDLLRKVHGRSELGLKAFWFEDVAFQEIVAENMAVRKLRDSLAGRSVEETYYDRIKLGELIETAMNRKREEDARRIQARLRPLAHDVRINTIISDRMVLNAAFLVENQRIAEFDQAVQTLDAELGQRMVFKFVGSAPPYNFVNIVLHWDEE